MPGLSALLLAARPAAATAKESQPTSLSAAAPDACYAKASQHVSQCHGAMQALGIVVGKDGQLVISDKKTFTNTKVKM
ncbi:hypothetical protein T484DRAFT_1893791 [Baffinella frigidus]|nr:hypothetical protein T484DRAFT_1893791 [Cryptophyta sp. CCMP2293]